MIKKMSYRLKILSKFIPSAKGVKRFFILSLSVSAVTLALSFVNPIFYRLFINEVILAARFDMMFFVALGYLGIFFANAALGYLKNYANYTLVNTVLYRVKFKIWQGFLKLPFPEYETADVGDMKMRLDDDTGQIRSFAEAQTVNYLISCMTIIVSLVFLVVIDWRLSLFAIIAIPMTFWIDNILSKREAALNNKNRENDQKISTWLHTSIQGWREVKALNAHIAQKRQFVRFLHNFAVYFSKWINYWVARSLIIPKIKDEFFMQFGLYFIGGLLIINDSLKIGDLFVFVIYYNMLSEAVRTVSGTDAELQANMPFTDRLASELEKGEDLNTAHTGKAVPDYSNTIVLENVDFKYPNSEEDVFQNFNLRIDRGERIAITGKSGCGKTTALKLITGMVSPTAGSVCFSGVNLENIDLNETHRRMGFVMQENMLFNTTIRENLLYAEDDASDAELADACEKAYIYGFIKSLPEGFDTVIGERGIKLSGGQKQRLVLARLFLQNVDIFIFDEATSALDQYSENIVHDAIRNIGDDKTVIVVAHRESSVNLCDRKIVLEGSRHEIRA